MIGKGWVVKMQTPKEKYTKIVRGMKEFFKETGFKKAVLGLSGGVDSALVAALAVAALGKDNVVGVTMPSRYSSNESKKLANKLGRNLGIKVYDQCIEEAVELFEHTVHKGYKMHLKGIPHENVQARLRMVYLMAYANLTNSLLLDTGNRTENLTGYATLYGDQAGSLQPIGDLNKVEVYEVCAYINFKLRINGHSNVIPQETIDRVPTAELSDGQVDPFDYKVDAPLIDWIFDEGAVTTEMRKLHSDEKLERLRSMIEHSAFKRAQSPPAIKVRVIIGDSS